MDYEELTNSSDYNVTNEIPPAESLRYIGHEIMFVIFSIIGICADSIMIYVILRFKRMRTLPYTFLVNWAISDLASLIVTPSAYRIISIIDNMPLPREFLCVLLKLGVTLHIATILFAILVSIDWFIASYFSRASKTFRQYYKFVVAAIWLFCLIFCITFSIRCATRFHEGIVPLIFAACLCLIGLTVIVLQCIRLVQKCRRRTSDYPTLMLTLVSTFVLMWITSILNIFFNGFIMFHRYLIMVSFCLMFSSSITNFSLLYCFDNNFRGCLLETFRCTRHRYREDMFETEESDIKEEQTSVRVTYHKPNQELLDNESI